MLEIGRVAPRGTTCISAVVWNAFGGFLSRMAIAIRVSVTSQSPPRTLELKEIRIATPNPIPLWPSQPCFPYPPAPAQGPDWARPGASTVRRVPCLTRDHTMPSSPRTLPAGSSMISSEASTVIGRGSGGLIGRAVASVLPAAAKPSPQVNLALMLLVAKFDVPGFFGARSMQRHGSF